MGRCGEAFDLAVCPLDHDLKVREELFVYGVVCGAEGVERGCAGSVENPEHGELLMSGGGLDGQPRAR
jgi:hypothetical protein